MLFAFEKAKRRENPSGELAMYSETAPEECGWNHSVHVINVINHKNTANYVRKIISKVLLHKKYLHKTCLFFENESFSSTRRCKFHFVSRFEIE